MSGYLQRLAARALSPRGSVHPVVGSFFSPPAFETEPENLATGQETWPAGAPQPSLEPNPGVLEDVSESIAPLAAPVRRPDPPQNAPERKAAELASRGATEAPTGAPYQARPRFPNQTRGVPFQPLAAYMQAAVSPGDNAAAPAASAIERRPRAPGQVRHVELPTAQTAQAPVFDAGRQPLAERPRAAAAGASSDPDEIRIHIGRIEVTAAPSAPVAPPPKTVRKSLDLGEYLKRGSRRV